MVGFKVTNEKDSFTNQDIFRILRGDIIFTKMFDFIETNTLETPFKILIKYINFFEFI